MSETAESASVPQAIIDLQRRVAALPSRRAAVERLAAIRDYKQRAQGAAVQQASARAGLDRLRQTFPGETGREADATLGKTVATARRLLRDVPDVAAVAKRGVDVKFQDLQATATKALGAVEKEWGAQVSAVTTRYQRIVDVATRAELPGSAALAATLARVDAARKPQDSQAARVAAHLAQIHEDVRTLGLEGPGGAFLARVAAGGADPRDLARPEVSAFLTQHDLWSLLSVRFAQ